MSDTAAVLDRGPTIARAPSALVGSKAQIRPFDYSRQQTVDRGRLRQLRPSLETFAHRFASALSSNVRQPVRVLVGDDIEQAVWDEYAQSLPDPTFVSSAYVLPFDGRMALHLPIPFALQLVDFYLGGDGAPTAERERLTDIEETLVHTLTAGSWKALPPAFASFIELSIGAVQPAVNAILVQLGRAGEMCVIFELRVDIADRAQFQSIQFCVPTSSITQILDQFERQQSGGADRRPDTRDAEQRLRVVPVDLTVSYPPIHLTPAELLSLRVGDVVPLCTRPAEGEPTELDILSGEITLGSGILTERGNRLVCTVTATKEEHR